MPLAHVLGRPYFLTLLAEAYGRAGRTKAGLEALGEATVAQRDTRERFAEADLIRLQRELLIRQGSNAEEPEACFHRTIDVARRQRARSLELRAVMSLGRLWRDEGKRKEARDQLSSVYDWFTEGFDTADLKDAKTLLEQLS